MKAAICETDEDKTGFLISLKLLKSGYDYNLNPDLFGISYLL